MDILTYAMAKSYANKAIEEASAIGFTPTVVEELPTTGEDHVLYFVPNDTNGMDEYIWADDDFKKVGSTSINFLQFYSKAELDLLFAGKQATLTAGTNITIENNVISASGEIAPIPSGNTLPTSGDEGDYFVLLVDTTNNAKGFYRHNGTAWIMIANASDYVMIHASSHTTEQGYVVPVLTDEEITSAYNGIVAGKNVFIVDDLDTITIQVYDAGNIDDIAIRIIFTDALIITYKVGGEIVSKLLGAGGGFDKVEITVTGESGQMTDSQMEDILDDSKITCIINDGEVYWEMYKKSTLTYKSYINTNAPLSDKLDIKVIYVNVNESAGNYGSWSLESIDLTVAVNDVTVNNISVVDSEGVAKVVVPTKTSDLTNDSGFVDENYHDDTKADVTDLPTKTSDLTNDSGFITEDYHDSTKQNVTDNSLTTTSKNVVGAINEIKGLVPAQATTSNQLADKNFVNSSIATNTSYFKGTYNSVAELPTTGVTNNDYAFVRTTDSEGNTVYNRYKYSSDTSQWSFEYALNNSSFTAEQFASINSGITSTDVQQIADNASDISDLEDNKQDVLTAGDNVDITDNVISATDTTYSPASESAYGLMKSSCSKILVLTQAQYDAITTKDNDTIYMIKE